MGAVYRRPCSGHGKGVVLPRVDGQWSDVDGPVGEPTVEEHTGQDDEYSNEALRKLGARVRHLRRKNGMTQRELSFDGCSYSYLARIEAGDRRPSPRVLMEIARRLGVTAEELSGETSTEQRSRSLELLDAAMMIRAGDLDDAEELLRGVLREAEVNGDSQRMSEAYEGLGAVAAERGEHAVAIGLLEQARDAGAPPDPAERVELFGRLFELYRRSGDVARALALLQDCLLQLRRSPVVDATKVVRYAVWLSRAYTEAGDPARAADVLGSALADGGDQVDLRSRAAAQYELSRRLAAAGEVEQALRSADRSLSLYELDEDNRALIRTIRDFDAEYDFLGNRVTMQSERDGAVRTTRYAYDSFGLVPERNTVETIGLPSIETSARYDPISLDTLTITDSNGVKRGTRFDGFGRVISNSLAVDGEPEGIVSTLDYRGFDGTDPAGRRIATRRFRDPISPNLIGSAQATETVIQFDELGRPRRAETGLGADYGGEKLVVSERVYDPRGRIRFEADPYAASAPSSTAYGTTYHFKTTGEFDCVIRGPGPQPLTEVSNPAAEIYPTCYDHNYVDNVDTLNIRDAASLETGSSQAGVVHRIVASAIGRVVERSTLKAGVPITLARFNHDRLGQLRSYVRFRDPASATGPVTWSWRTDSLGQVLQLDEAGAASRMLSYSDWGELTETRWQDGGADRRIVNQFDALSRLTASFATTNGVVDPGTRNDYGYDQPLLLSPFVTPSHLAHRLSWAAWPGGNVAFGYDALGGVTSRVFTDEGGTAYIQRSHYDFAGYLLSLAFNLPDNGYAVEISKYGYDSAGRLRRIDQGDVGPPRRVFDVEAVDPLGRVLKAHLGRSVVAFQYAPDGRRLLKESIVESPQGSERLIYLRHDALGRELSRRTFTDNAADGPKTDIAFDALGRLSQVIRSVGASTQADWVFSYDPLGNVTALKDMIGQADATLSYQAADPDRACRVGYGNGGLGGSPTDCNVSHDALGNVTRYATRNGERQLSYLATGEVSAVSEPGATAALSFDALGSLARLTLSDSLSRPLRNQRFFGGTIEQRDIAGASTILRNIPGPAGLIATRRGASDRWIYEIGERRGRRSFVDQNGEFIQRADYAPFGEASTTGAAVGSSDRSEHLWNNGTNLEPIGLVQLGQRAYDPVLGRFLSRDPLLTTRDAGRSNPYGFAAGDPINNANSTGVDCEGVVCQPANPPFLPFGIEYLLRYGSDTSGPPLPQTHPSAGA